MLAVLPILLLQPSFPEYDHKLLENMPAFSDDVGHHFKWVLMTFKALLLIDQNTYSFLIEDLAFFCVYLYRIL